MVGRTLGHTAGGSPGFRYRVPMSKEATAVTTPSEPHRLPSDTDNGLLLVISGPSGVGKTTITRAVERSIPGSIFSISATTRPKSDADTDGVDYHFLTDEQFDAKVEADEFLEHAVYVGNKYGTLRAPVEVQLQRGRLVILDIDVQGAKQVKRAMPDAFAIFILPPDEATLLERLRSRKRDSDEAIRKRFEHAQTEIASARESGIYDAYVENDDLDRAIAEAVRLVTERRDITAD